MVRGRKNIETEFYEDEIALKLYKFCTKFDSRSFCFSLGFFGAQFLNVNIFNSS